MDSKGTQSHIYMYPSILPQTRLLSKVPRNMEQSSMSYTVGSCWLSILSIAVVHDDPKLPNFLFLPSFSPAAISSFSVYLKFIL